MSEPRLCVVRERRFGASCYMMSVMREMEDYVLNIPILLPSAYEKLVENSG